MREMGMDPAAISASSVPIHVLVNGSRITLPSGSLRERWQVFRQVALEPGETLEAELGLAIEDFSAARAYLKEELVAFGRSRTVTALSAPGENENEDCQATDDFSSTASLSNFQFDSPDAEHWEIVNGRLYETNNASNATALMPAETFADGYVEVLARSTDNDSQGVIIRAQDKDNYYRFHVNQATQKARLTKLENGDGTVLKEIDLEDFVWTSPGHVLRIAAQGNVISAFMDGEPMASATDDTFSTGMAGLFSSSNDPAIFDNLVIYSTTRATGCDLFPADFAWFAATGTPPTAKNYEYWATATRWYGSPESFTFNFTGSRDPGAADYNANFGLASSQVIADEGLAVVADAMLTLGAEVVDEMLTGTNSQLTDAVQDQVTDKVGQVLAYGKTDRPGRIVVIPVSTQRVLHIDGYSEQDGVHVVDTDNLACATEGAVEGQKCVLQFLDVAAAEDYDFPSPGFTQAVRLAIPFIHRQRVYVVKAKTPGDSGPGNFEALAGYFQVNMTSNQRHVVPITPEWSKRAADMIRPSPEWCTFPGVECNGDPFDARMPLENELTDDGDNVESSWKHYLGLARQSADEATFLAESYLNSGVELDTLTQQEQLREAQDRIRFLTRAETELETVQSICGTAIETTQLMHAIGAWPKGMRDAIECSTDEHCASRKGQCVAGSCVTTPFGLLDSPDRDESLDRIRECIGDDTVEEFVALGSTPMCVWESLTHNGLICQGADYNNPCPRPKNPVTNQCEFKNSQGMSSRPDGTQEVLVTETIGLFDNERRALGISDPCDAIRTLRQPSVDPLDREALIATLVAYGLFDKAKLAAWVPRISWQAAYANHSSLRLDGAPVFSTGDPLHGIVSSTWPCAPYAVPLASGSGTRAIDCTNNPDALYCQSINCSNWDQRTAMNRRMLRAAWGLHATTVAYNPGAYGELFDGYSTQARFDERYLPYVDYYWTASGLTDERIDGPKGYPGLLLPTRRDIFTSYEESVPKGEYAIGNGTVKEYATIWGGTAFIPSSTDPSVASFWADLGTNGTPPLVGTPTPPSDADCSHFTLARDIPCKASVYAIEPLISYGKQEEVSRFSNGEPYFDWYDPQERISAWDDLYGYSAIALNQPGLFEPPEIAGRVVGLLTRQGPFWGPGPYLDTSKVDGFAFPAGTGHLVAPGAPKAADNEIYDALTQFAGTYDYEPSSILDAAEMYCEITRSSAQNPSGFWSSTAEACPNFDVNTFDGTPDHVVKLRNMLVCKAERITQQIGQAVLQRIPKLAYANLLNLQGPRAFPSVGGRMGSAISDLRAALIRYRDYGFEIQTHAIQVEKQMSVFAATLEQVGIQQSQAQSSANAAALTIAQDELKMSHLEVRNDGGFWGDVMGVVSDFAQGVSTGLSAFATTGNPYVAVGVAAVSTGINLASRSDSESKADELATYEQRVQDLQTQIDTELQKSAQAGILYHQWERAKLLAQTEHDLHVAVLELARLANLMKAELETFDSKLADIEGLRLEAQRALGRAMHYESSEAAITPQIRGVLAARKAVAKQRYLEAHQNAVKFAFLAKRAIEQRLGIRLADLRTDLPLVEAPYKWESSLCQSSGVDYDALANAASASGGSQNRTVIAELAKKADPFIGEYVTKLENVVESYLLEFNFQDATDEAVISLRDDLLNVRAPCEAESQNLLYRSSEVTPNPGVLEMDGEFHGWQAAGCPAAPAPCLTVVQTADNPDGTGASEHQVAHATQITYLTNTAGIALEQTIRLAQGTFMLSWYDTMTNATPQLLRVFDEAGQEVTYNYSAQAIPTTTAGWSRRYSAFDVDPEGGLFTFSFVRPGLSTSSVSVMAPMLENVTNTMMNAPEPEFVQPSPFQSTGDSRMLLVPICQDTTGETFRSTKWSYDCIKICETGLGTDCEGRKSCFWQTDFSLSERDIEAGLILNQSGFARGNFNYRIETMGINFVGTNARNCEGEELEQACLSGGFLPYSLIQTGPFLVRNHMGGTYIASLFNGTIEHARGLALERYLTNPLSEADRGLMSPFLRSEMQGRPMDANYQLRVWDEPGVNFEAIQDVQVHLKYRYWTRND
jgi:hypothetical protein